MLCRKVPKRTYNGCLIKVPCSQSRPLAVSTNQRPHPARASSRWHSGNQSVVQLGPRRSDRSVWGRTLRHGCLYLSYEMCSVADEAAGTSYDDHPNHESHVERLPTGRGTHQLSPRIYKRLLNSLPQLRQCNHIAGFSPHPSESVFRSMVTAKRGQRQPGQYAPRCH